MGEAIKYSIRWERDMFGGLIGYIMGKSLTISNKEWEGMEFNDNTWRIIVLVLGIEWKHVDVIHYGMFPNIGYNGDIHCDVTNHESIKPIIMELRICYTSLRPGTLEWWESANWINWNWGIIPIVGQLWRVNDYWPRSLWILDSVYLRDESCQKNLAVVDGSREMNWVVRSKRSSIINGLV